MNLSGFSISFSLPSSPSLSLFSRSPSLSLSLYLSLNLVLSLLEVLLRSAPLLCRYPSSSSGPSKNRSSRPQLPQDLELFDSVNLMSLCSKNNLNSFWQLETLESCYPSSCPEATPTSCDFAPMSCMHYGGVSPEEGTGATMSDDNDDQVYSDTNIFDGSFDE